MPTHARHPLAATLGLSLVGTLLAGCSLSDDAKTFRFDEPIERVDVDVDAGIVSFVPASGEASRVDARREWGLSDAPEVAVWVEKGTLFVRGDCPSSTRLSCNTDFSISVPAEAELSVDLETGSVELAEFAGPIFADVITGEIQGWGLRADILHAEVNTGSIDLEFSAGANTVHTEVVTGDLELAVPDQMYRVQAEVTTGDLDIEVPTSPTAEAFIGAKVVTGAVYVRATR